MGGWMAVLYQIDKDGAYEPISTGIGRYHNQEQAEAEAEDWAKAEGLQADHNLVNEKPKQQTNNNMEHEPVSIKKIKSDKDDGDNVKCIQGTITKLFPIKKGSGSGGEFEYQNGEFKDNDGDTIKICFSKCSQPDGAKGKKVTITSIRHDTHGWLGIKIADSEYVKNEGKDNETKVKERQLKIVPSAEIKYEGGAPSSEPARTQTSGGGSSSSRQDLTLHPKLVLKDICLMHARVTDLVNEIYKGAEGVTPEFIQGAVGTVFIESARSGLHHDFEKRYNAELPKVYPPAPKDPKDWDVCVIPKGEFAGKTLKELPTDKLRELHVALDKNKSNTPFAECVYQAAKDRKIFEKEKPPADPDLDPPEDDIPF